MDGPVDVAGTGFTALDRIYDSASHHEALGGSCGNVLLSLAMLEKRVAPVLSLGEDTVAEKLIEIFQNAGVDTQFISRSSGRSSPILAQHLDEISGEHWFSFTCPETDIDFPRYTAIDVNHVLQAQAAINSCSIFYTDRLSEAILEAMEMAANSGAIVYFEPSSIEADELHQRALSLTSILKCSAERIAPDTQRFFDNSLMVITTYGSEGLEISKNGESYWSSAVPVKAVRDACGSGDMVSVGIIDWILSHHLGKKDISSINSILEGVAAGQRLAAANCYYPGARGLFNNLGSVHARAILNGVTHSELLDEFTQQQ